MNHDEQVSENDLHEDESLDYSLNLRFVWRMLCVEEVVHSHYPSSV